LEFNYQMQCEELSYCMHELVVCPVAIYGMLFVSINTVIRVRVKIKLSVCLIKCHAMKAYGEVEVQHRAFYYLTIG